MSDPDRYTLVHGNVEGLRQDEVVNHAWVEEGDIVHEVSGGRHLSFFKAVYYQKYEITNIRTYTLKQALEQCIESSHYGPWN